MPSESDFIEILSQHSYDVKSFCPGIHRRAGICQSFDSEPTRNSCEVQIQERQKLPVTVWGMQTMLHSCPTARNFLQLIGATHTHTHILSSAEGLLVDISAPSSWYRFSFFSLLHAGVSRADAWRASSSDFGTAYCISIPQTSESCSKCT